MSDLISRQAVLDKAYPYGNGDAPEGFCVDVEDIQALPSAQPEIVRCKDCKYSHMTYDGDCKYCDIWFPDEPEYMPGDYYCGSAERRQDE